MPGPQGLESLKQEARFRACTGPADTTLREEAQILTEYFIFVLVREKLVEKSYSSWLRCNEMKGEKNLAGKSGLPLLTSPEEW